MLRFTALLLISACGLFAAETGSIDPGLLNLVMPDAKVMAGVNVTAAEASPLGQFVLEKISADNQRLQKLISVTGFDPRIDLAQLLVASSADPANPGGLLLARGTFNVTEISAAAANVPNAQIETYDNDPLIVFTNSKTQRTQAAAFIGSTIAVAGPVDAVKAALDRSSNTTNTSSSLDPSLLAQVNQISATEDEWVVSILSPAALAAARQQSSGSAAPPATAGFNASLKNIQSFSGGINFGTSDVLTAQFNTSDSQNATALANVLKFALSLVTMNAQKSSSASELAQIFSNVQVSVNGTAVNVLSTVPDAEVETLLTSLPRNKKAN